MTEALLKGHDWWIAECLPKEKAVIVDSLALFFISSRDDWASDPMGSLFVFFIFLLEFHTLVLTITGATDLDLYSMVKDTVQDRTGRERII